MGTPGSPQQMQRQQMQHRHQLQMQHQQQMAQQYGYAPLPYEQQHHDRGGPQQGPDGSYMPVENGGIVYFVKSPNAPPHHQQQQHYAPQNPYYDPYAQQQAYGQPQDPAIMMSSGGGYGGQGGQMYQHWG